MRFAKPAAFVRAYQLIVIHCWQKSLVNSFVFCRQDSEPRSPTVSKNPGKQCFFETRLRGSSHSSSNSSSAKLSSLFTSCSSKIAFFLWRHDNKPGEFLQTVHMSGNWFHVRTACQQNKILGSGLCNAHGQLLDTFLNEFLNVTNMAHEICCAPIGLSS